MEQSEPAQCEPLSVQDWIARDPMRALPALLPSDQGEFSFVFDVWRQLPPRYRWQVWREREIAAHLYSVSRSWVHIPGIRTIGVGKRQVNDRRRLVAIVTFEILVPREVTVLYEQYEIPH